MRHATSAHRFKIKRDCEGTDPDYTNRINEYFPNKEFAMNAHLHTMSNLFAQLGLPADEPAIEDFLAKHRPLGNGVALYRASFWSPSQRAFLKEEIIEDADWAGVIDELNNRLN
jgi:hypothetical protein